MNVRLFTQRITRPISRIAHHLQSKYLVYFSHLRPFNHCPMIMVVSAVVFIPPLESASHPAAFLKEHCTLLIRSLHKTFFKTIFEILWFSSLILKGPNNKVVVVTQQSFHHSKSFGDTFKKLKSFQLVFK